MKFFKTPAAAIFACMFVLGYAAQAHASTAYYVSTTGSDSNPCSLAQPCLTLTHVQSVVQSAISGGMTSDVYVYLRGGTYTLSSTLTFGAADSGRNGYTVIWSSYPNESAIISGGQTVTGWSLYSGSIYRAAVSTSTDFRQMYVNGSHATRARGSSNPTGWSVTSYGYTAPDTTVGGYGNLTDVEIVALGSWWMQRCKIASTTTTSIYMQQPCWRDADAHGHPSVSWVENAYELMATSSWYFDRTAGYLYYWPSSGSMSGLTVTIPVVGPLVTGTLASNLKFTNITFAYSNWTVPDQNNLGYAGAQSGVYWTTEYSGSGGVIPSNASYPEGAVHFASSTNLTLDHNEFTHLGSRAILLDYGDQNVFITGNRFDDNADGAMQIGGLSDYNTTDTTLQVRNILVQNNYIASGNSFDYYDTGQIFSTYAAALTIDHNTIYGSLWSPIAVGWGWNWNNSYDTNNTVTNNRLYNFCSVFSDCGGIYTNNSQSKLSTYADGMTLSGNFMGNGNIGNGCFYSDEHSAYVTWTGNTCISPGSTQAITLNIANHIQIINNYMSSELLTSSASTNVTSSPNYLFSSTAGAYAACLGTAGVPISVTPGVSTTTPFVPIQCGPTLTPSYWPTWRSALSYGLVAYWPIGEGNEGIAYDYSPTGNQLVWKGTASGTSTYYSAGRNAGTWAGYLNGSDNYLLGTSTLTFGTTDFSMSAWVKSTQTQAVIFGKRASCGTNPFVSMEIYTGGAKTGVFAAEISGPSANYTYFLGTIKVADGTWHHITLTRSGATIKGYVDGGLDATSTGPAAANIDNTNAFEIGQGPCATSYNGSIADVRIYNRALSAAEVRQIYNSGR